MAERLEDVTAAILAGGLGTRLRCCIADRPKVLAPVRGRPYLTYLLEQLAEAGIRNVVLLTGYLGEQVRAAFGERYAELWLTYSRETTPLGTAGALRQALPCLHSTTVLLLNGDSYCATSMQAFWQFHRRNEADLSLVLTHVEDCSRYGKAQLGDGNRLLRFEEKSRAGGAGWVNTGIGLLDRALIEAIPTVAPLSLEGDLFPQWLADKRCFGLPCPARFLDIGTPESYAQAESFFSHQRRKSS